MFPFISLRKVQSMKKVLWSLVIVGVMIVGAVQAEDRIAFVDVQEVFKGFYKTQLAQDQIRQQADDIKMEREEMEEEIEMPARQQYWKEEEAPAAPAAAPAATGPRR